MPIHLPKLPGLRLDKSKIIKLLLTIGLIVIISGQVYLNIRLNKLNTDISKLNETQSNFSQNFSEDLFNDHLTVTSEINTQEALTTLQTELDKVKSSSSAATVDEIYQLYSDFQNKVQRNTTSKLDVVKFTENLPAWGQQLLSGDFETIKTSLSSQIATLDSEYQKYLDSLPKPEPVTSSEGYSYTTVSTEKGKFGVSLFKFPMSSVTIKTVSANSDNCKDNCPTKNLETYVKENNGYAGINGTYFCPPDYGSCSGKVNSYDYAFYNSNRDKWLNKSALTWSKTGLMTFNGSSVKFYKKSSDYGGGGVTAGISNYPSLLEGGNYVVKLEDLTAYQKDSRGPKGFIGTGDSNIYLGIVYNATVPEAAYAVKALGVKDALNIDGGGSSAMYIGGKYVVGPGRNLPNAIIIVK
jgi:hypothetical protein